MADLSEGQKSGMTIGEKRPYKEIAAQKREEVVLEMSSGQTAMKAEGSRKRKRAPAKDKKNKDKGPKRATTAFFFFSQEERPNIRAKNPELRITEVSKELGKMWKEMSDKQKEKYTQLAEKDRKRYQAEKAALENKAGSQESVEVEEEEEED